MLMDFLGAHASLERGLALLFDAAIKGALLVGIAAVAAHLLRSRSAASRHAVWTGAVVGHLAIPTLIFLLPAWTLPLLPPAPWTLLSAPAVASSRLVTDHLSQTSRATPAVSAAENASPAPATFPSGIHHSTPPLTAGTVAGLSKIQVAAVIWFIGALLMLLRLAIGTWRVGQLARQGAHIEDPPWLSLTQRLANGLSVRRPLILLRGDNLAVPVTWGIAHPAVLLPQDADSWSDERRRVVLVHEIAHVKRFDALTQLLAQLSLAIFWFDPLVWLAEHRMRIEREHACDDYVLRDGTTPSLYAGELLEMARSIGTARHDRAAPAFAALAMARRSEFEGRMLAILDPKLDRHSLDARTIMMTAAIISLLTLPLAAWQPFHQPAAGGSRLSGVSAPTARESIPGAALSTSDAEPVARQIPRELAGSSGDLSSIIRKLPRTVMRISKSRAAVADALGSITSSSDRARLMEVFVSKSDPEMLALLATAAHAVATIPVSGDMRNVLISVVPFGAGDPSITAAVIEASKGLPVSGDAADVLISIARSNLLSNPQVRDEYVRAAMALPVEADRRNALAAAAGH
jgi:beta-lactamase regulating signal transducer with metallopeptidase domain